MDHLSGLVEALHGALGRCDLNAFVPVASALPLLSEFFGLTLTPHPMPEIAEALDAFHLAETREMSQPTGHMT